MKRYLTILALTVVPAVSYAQDTANNWPGLDTTRLPTVYVLDDTGQETEGKLLRLDASSLVILAAGTERRFDAGSVRRIEKRDGLRNGTIIGAVVGAAVGAVGATVSDCNDPGVNCPGLRVGLFLLSTGAYAAIGMGIDALIPGRTTLYEAPAGRPSAGGVGFDLRPSLGRVDVGLRFRW